MKKLSFLLLSVLASVGLVGGTSYADFRATIPADPTDGAMSDIETSVQTWVITYGVPVLFTLLLLDVLIKLGLKWARRGARAIG